MWNNTINCLQFIEQYSFLKNNYMLTCTAFRASVTLEVSLSDSQKKMLFPKWTYGMQQWCGLFMIIQLVQKCLHPWSNYICIYLMWLNLMIGFKLLILGINILYQKGKRFFFFHPSDLLPELFCIRVNRKGLPQIFGWNSMMVVLHSSGTLCLLNEKANKWDIHSLIKNVVARQLGKHGQQE